MVGLREGCALSSSPCCFWYCSRGSYYLWHGGLFLADVYLYVSRITQKVVDKFWWNFWRGAMCKNWIDFGVEPDNITITAALVEVCTQSALVTWKLQRGLRWELLYKDELILTLLFCCSRLRNDLYCVEWDVKP